MGQHLVNILENWDTHSFNNIFIICPLNIVVSVSLNFLLYQSSLSSRIFFSYFLIMINLNQYQIFTFFIYHTQINISLP